MKQEIFKVNYESYSVVVYRDSTPIDFPHWDNKFWNREKTSDILPRLKKKRKKPLVFIEDYSSSVEEEFIQNYGNRLSKVRKTYVMVVVERKGDKVSIKMFNGRRERRGGNVWFSSTRNVDYITVNTKTGDVYTGYLYNYQSKRKIKRKITKNFFLSEPTNELGIKIRSCVWSYVQNHTEVTRDAIAKFMSEIDGKDESDVLNFEKRLFKFYLDKKGIKYPDNFYLYTKKLVGPKIRKCLKKNDYRLIDTFMQDSNLSGKQLKTALHRCKYLNIDLYLMAKKMFGDDWINQEPNFILNTLNSMSFSFLIPTEFHSLIGKEELKKVFVLFKKVFFEDEYDSFVFLDHIIMYTELKQYGETDLKWMSDGSNRQSYRDEHLNWSDKIVFYKDGHYDRVYPKYIYDIIEQPIGEYYPVVLDNSTTHNDESSIQSNCVKTYVVQPSSIIISLRKGSRDSEERATVEYKLKKKSNKIYCQQVQSLGKYNGKLSEEWDEPLFNLSKLLLLYIGDKRFETIKIIKKLSNGTIIKSDSEWTEDGELVWLNKVI